MITQSWLTPWGFQLKSLPNSEELEEVTKIIILEIIKNIEYIKKNSSSLLGCKRGIQTGG